MRSGTGVEAAITGRYPGCRPLKRSGDVRWGRRTRRVYPGSRVPREPGEANVTEIPKLISVDDHVVEPPTLWWDRLPVSVRDRAPHVERVKGRVCGATRGGFMLVDEDPDAPGADWADLWVY